MDWRKQDPILYLPSDDTQQRSTPVTKDEHILGKIQSNKPIKSLSKKQRIALISALAMIVVFMVCINSNQSSTAPHSVTKPAPLPAPIRHDISIYELTNNSAYWNTSWQNSTDDLINITRKINQQYLQTHTYIANETDCNDMAVDIWNMLWKQGIRSIIVLGNIDNSAPLTSLNQCNHVFLLILNLERGDSIAKGFILEPTNGECYFREDFERNPQLNLYHRGFYYTQPSDLRTDLGKNW